MSSLRIGPISGYTPTIGRLVAMLGYTRRCTLETVEGLTLPELDHVFDDASNSIGALLAHIAAVEWWFQVLTFEGRKPTPEEESSRLPALDLGAEGRRHLRDRELAEYLAELAAGRERTLRALAARDDAWLEQSLEADPRMNAHWAWFHVGEDETSHRGQIRWLRARLPRAR